MLPRFNCLTILKNTIVFVIILFSMSAFVDAEIYREIRIYTDFQLNEHTDLKQEFLVSDFAKGYFDIFVNEYEFDSIASNNFEYEILNNDVEHFYANRLNENKLSLELRGGEYFRLGSLGGYFRCDEIYAEFDRMIEKYPNLISKSVIAYSYENNPIYSYCISSNSCSSSENKPQILFTALHHGNEQGSAFALLYYFWNLFERYDNEDKLATYIISNKHIIIIPVVNPDGVIYNDTIAPNGGGMWRKNRRINSDGSIGVDLNRNYGPDYAWNAANNGSSIRGNLETYRGDSAFSEPETRSIRDFVAGKSIKIAVNVHTYGNCVINPYSFQTQTNPDSLWYRGFLSEKFRNSGYLFGLDVDVIRFPYRGTSDDFMYIGNPSFNSIKAMTLEIGSYANGFWAPINSMIEESEKNISFFDDALLSAENNVALEDKDIFTDNGRYFVKLTLQNIGLEEINGFQYSLSSNRSDLFVEKTIYTVSGLRKNEKKDLFIEYFPSGIANGEIAKFVLNIDLDFSKKIEFELPVYEFEEEDLFSNKYLNQWNSSDSWVFTQNEFDEPVLVSNIDKLYGNLLNSYIFFKHQASSDSISRYTLKYEHWYDIETNFDFGLIWAKGDSGSFRNMTYGEYMVKGSNRIGGVQDDNLWGFHGVFNYWSPQLVYLGNSGDKISELAFNLRTDGGLNKTGWKIKNLKLRKYLYKKTPDTFTDKKGSNFLLFPNPANSFLDIRVNYENMNNPNVGFIFIFNASGEQIEKIPLHQNQETYRLDIAKFIAGTYFVKYRGKILKFIKI